MYENLEERCDHMRKIQPKDQKWTEDRFETKGYIYYKKTNSLVICHCGACGAMYTGSWKASEDPFEAVMQHLIKPAHNKPGKCERCGYETKYKAMGKVKAKYINAKGRYVIGQRMGKDEFVFRVFDVEQVMYNNKKTEYDHMEYIRIFLRPGKKAQKDYRVWDPRNRVERWIDHNLGGMSNIPMPDDAYITPSTWREIRSTPMFKYVPDPTDPVIRGKYLNGRLYPVMRYYEAAAHYSDFEMIVKTGMYYLQSAMVWKCGTGYRAKGRTYYDRLGIYKTRVKELIAKHGDTLLLKTLQCERRCGKHWNDKEFETALMRINIECAKDAEALVKVYKYISPSRFENYLGRIAQEEGCGSHGEYYDYIRMRSQLGYDLSNEIILLPKELHRRHNEMVLETEKGKLEERKKEVIKKYPKIADKYKQLSDKYSATAAGYIIRPAKDAAEIVTEGRILHHCVGGDMYLSKHNTGKSVILFLHKTSEADTPFITVEIKGEKIIQWYGAYDKKPEKEFFDAWLKTYTTELKKRKKKNEKKVTKTA